MNNKRMLWVILLIVVIIIIAGLINFANKANDVKMSSSNTETNTTYNKDTNAVNPNEVIETSNKVYEKKELEDGILYSLGGEEYKPDIVIGDNYFDTTINDMFLNSDNYMNKNIEIEGMYFENLPYTFVGRYSTSSLCPYCPTGYSYLEYQLNGTIDKTLTDSEDWIKVIGTLAKGNDESSYFQDYYYLDVLSIEVMNEKGQDTVSN